MKFEVEFDGFDEVSKLLNEYPGKAHKIITDVIHNEGAEEIKRDISHLLPSSGRHWKGKGASAKAVMPGKFSQKNEPASITISAKRKYKYLYFPDDGSNTRRHAGNQHFMLHGAENATSKVIKLCIGKLSDGFNES